MPAPAVAAAAAEDAALELEAQWEVRQLVLDNLNKSRPWEEVSRTTQHAMQPRITGDSDTYLFQCRQQPCSYILSTKDKLDKQY